MKDTFKKFYNDLGLDNYPFRNRTAETEDTAKLFVKPLDYSMLEDVLSSQQTALICGNRGSGKTIMLSDLKSKVSADRLVCFIDNYESVPLQENKLDFYSLILQTITKDLLIFLASHNKLLRKASKDNKLFLSFLIMKYGDNITDDQLYSEIQNVQLNGLQKLINKFSRPLTFFLNYGTTAITNFGDEMLTKYFGIYLPPVNEGSVKKIFPDIHFAVSNEFKSAEISYSLLNKALMLINNLIGSIPLIFIDKLDEDIRLENDAEIVANFVKDLICDNNLLLNHNVQLCISIWQIPFSYLSTIFRRSKHYVYDIDWNQQQLETVLNRRIFIYSNYKITDYHKLFWTDVSEHDIQNIYILSNSNPRDLWGIFDEIFKAQYEIDDSLKLINRKAIILGLKNFVEHFGFYEYYPKKKDAQRNTNDIYSYIGYLLRLQNTDEFTNEELRQAANTGGSTKNYISGMMHIGLAIKTDKKRPGGAIIYKIKDPKVSYAIFNHIDIIHE